ncbi:unnamed protein product [Orchesella dallaii]|uniref:Uncharacterized protein n=1 Tax=Orchesella dallaii TaxID=48710 RepID=A0ABP1S832_9HEXA
MSNFAKAVKDYASKYDGFKVHSLEGLNDFLKPVQHCFIHMTNFGGVNLPSLSVPSIQMKTKLAFFCANTIHAISSSLDLRENKTLRKDCYLWNMPPCPLSSLFADSNRMCVRINFRKFVNKIPPWTCEVVVSLFQKQPTISNRRNSFSGKIQEQNSVIPFEQNHESVVRNVERLLPSYAPINILITEKQDELACPQNWEFPNNIGVWFKYSINENVYFYPSQISRDTYFVVLTSPIDIKTRSDTIDYQVFRINTVFSLKTMPVLQTQEIQCVRSARIFMQGNNFLMKQKYSALTYTFDASSIYLFSIVALGKVVMLEEFLHESICNSMYLKWAAKFLYNSFDAYSVSILGEWLQILRRYNYTISIDRKIVICKVNHHILKTKDEAVQSSATVVNSHNKVYPTAVSHPLAIDDPSQKVGFIACGDRPIDYPAFRELVRVFDLHVWICVCIIYLAIVPIILCILEWLSENYKLNVNVQRVTRQNVFSSRIFLQPITILLEQGNAFTNKHLNVGAIRWIAAAVILVAIVLSIGYEENISLKKVIESDHTISFIDEKLKSRILRSEVENIFRTEMASLITFRENILRSWVGGEYTSTTLTDGFGENLLKHTKLHPYEKELAKLRRYDDYRFDLELDNSKMAHDNGQTHYLSQLLIECNNTAIVLPLSNIQKMFPIIQNQGHTKLSVGKEILFERRVGMALDAWISDQLITTLSRMHDVGLWQHIRNIFVRNITTTFDGTRDFSYQTSQISGNILVVFVTFLCGHVVAALSFIFEIRKRIYVWTILLAQSVYTGLKKLWSQTKAKYVRHRNGYRLTSRFTTKCCRRNR